MLSERLQKSFYQAWNGLDNSNFPKWMIRLYIAHGPECLFWTVRPTDQLCYLLDAYNIDVTSKLEISKSVLITEYIFTLTYIKITW